MSTATDADAVPIIDRENSLYGNCNYASSSVILTIQRLTSFSALQSNFSAQDPDHTYSPAAREHVLELIQRWFENHSAERILWLYGPASAGRSTIAHTIVDANMQEDTVVVATFFFSQSDPNSNDGNRLFPTLAWQLSGAFPAIEDHITLNATSDLLERGVETQFEELIVRPFLALNERTSAVRQRAPVVVIDGIDECLDEKLQQRILKVIGTAVRNPDFPLRFLISSRHEAHIEETIHRFETPTLRVDSAAPYDADSAIEQYLRGKFARIAAEKELEPTWPDQQIVRRLVSRSDGQFSYAAVVIGLVGDRDNDAKTQLDIILELKPLHTISPFAGLDGLYLEILERVPDQDFLKPFLGLLVGRCSISRDSLSNDDAMLTDVSGIELEKKLRQMRSILTPEPYIEFFRPFLDFLQDSSRSSQYHVSKSTGTRRYLDLIAKLLVKRTARLTAQPDFHGTNHFAPKFAKVINRIELDIEDWEQILRPLLNVLGELLRPSKIDSLKDGNCRQCQFFQITYATLTHLKSLRKGDDPGVEKLLKSLEEIIRYPDRRQPKSKFGGVFSALAVLAVLAALAALAVLAALAALAVLAVLAVLAANVSTLVHRR